MPTDMKKIVIIGGGIGGLASANLLAKAGYDVHIYEKNAQLGGRAGSRTDKGFTFDTGPSWYLMPEVFEQYFDLFNVAINHELSMKQLRPAYKVFFEGHPSVTIQGNITKDAVTFDSIEKGAGVALKQYVKEGEAIYNLAIKHFLYTNFESARDILNRDVIKGGPRMLRLLFQTINHRVETFVKAKPLQQILEYPMVFLGTSPFKAPAMYSLMSALDFKQGVFYPKRGMYSIIELLVRIGKDLGVSYHVNENVTEIAHEGKSAIGIISNGTAVDADVVISNADLHFTETNLVAPSVQSYPESAWHKKESGISALLLYIGVKGELPQLEHHNLFFVDAWKENFQAIYDEKTIPEAASLYVSRTSATDKHTAPRGHENLFILAPLPSGIFLDETAKQQLAEKFIDQVGHAIDTPDLGARIVTMETFGPNEFRDAFNAWDGTALGMSHILKQSAFWRTPNKSKKLNNLYYVGGNTVPGIGLPMCLISAQLVYKRIIGIRKGGPVTTIKENR